MNKILNIIIAIIIGLLFGSMINMGIILIGPYIIPNPIGYDNSSMETMNNSIHLLKPIHLLIPFLAHAIGTFIGALFASLIVKKRKMLIALSIGVFFLAGGIYMAVIVSSPLWFILLDLIVAYIPMAYLAGKINS